MIRNLTLKDVGPARDLKFEFSPRLNVITGDNGLGKTFVLDVLWWVLTTTWAGETAVPLIKRESSRRDPYDPDFRAPSDEDSDDDPWGSDQHSPTIEATLATDARDTAGLRVAFRWHYRTQEWEGPSEGDFSYPSHDELEAEFRPPTLVVYARADGSYAIFDSYYAPDRVSSFAEAAIHLTQNEVWDGQQARDGSPIERRRTVIAGLIADWVNWQQRARSPEFAALRKALHALSSPDEPLIPDEPIRVHRRDRRDIPTLATSFGVVPVTLASAGIRRALSLAYLLVWAWTEHQKAARASGQRTTRDVVLMIDEPELHLHPGWQRSFLPAVLRAVSMIAPNAAVQMFTATHSPLVLASLENAWVEALDDLFVMERDGSLVRANEQDFVREGDVTAWLASSVFGGVSGRSRGAELAIDAAQHFMADRPREADDTLRLLYDHLDEQPRPRGPHDEDVDWLKQVAEEAYRRRPLMERVHDALKHTLPGHDEFWVHWTLVYRPGRRKREDGDAAR